MALQEFYLNKWDLNPLAPYFDPRIETGFI